MSRALREARWLAAIVGRVYAWDPSLHWLTTEIAASLALDGLRTPPTRRKLPACTPVFKKGMPF